jgi:hypothetical protein
MSQFDAMPPSRQAGILCNDLRFRRFVAHRLRLPTTRSASVSPQAAEEYLRRQCRVSSRRMLDTDNNAANRFRALRTDFDAWTGRIPSPR